MVKEVRNCVNCGLGTCQNCTYIEMKRDKCGEEFSELYDYDGEELCEYCLLETVPKVDIDNEIHSNDF